MLGLIPTSSSISNCEVSSLDHEVLDDSVELRPFVAVTFLQRHTGHLLSVIIIWRELGDTQKIWAHRRFNNNKDLTDVNKKKQLSLIRWPRMSTF